MSEMTEQSAVEAALDLSRIKYDAAGLVPAVVQDAVSKEVLMLAYMNEESLRLSLTSVVTWFWSRSRSELWNKGATSGHTQRIRSLRYDCDGDTLLVLVDQTGPACHTGQYSCFHNSLPISGGDIRVSGEKAKLEDRSIGGISPESVDSDFQGTFEVLGELERTIAERYAERPEGAYTSYLFDKGLDKILKKFGEESTEVVIAAKNGDNDELRNEAGDLIFHLLVLLRERGLPLDEIMSELQARHGRPTTNKMNR